MIEIKETPNGETSMNCTKGTKWTTFINGAEMLVEVIMENAKDDVKIDNILEDIKQIYLHNINKDKNENRDS